MSAQGPEACPVCGKAKDAKFKPFCSRRCADVDLGRWFKGDYAIPGGPEKPPEGGGTDEE